MALGKIDYDAHSGLFGIKPPINPQGYNRGGKIADGTLAKMVTLGLEKIAQGYVDVVVLFDTGVIEGKDNGLIGPVEIKAISERADFPKE